MATEGAATLRRVTASVEFAWDGGVSRLQAGTVIAVEPGSYLELSIGAGNLEDLDDAAAEALAAHAGVSN